MDTLPENKVSLTDIEAGGRCVTCPACLVCDFDDHEYRGQPFVAADWMVYTPQLELAEVSTLSSTVVQYPGSLSRSMKDIPVPLRTERVRDVYGCPYEGACKPERTYRNVTSYELDLEDNCETGFSDQLCAVCDSGYSRTKDGCSLCANVGATIGTYVAMLLVAFLVIICRRWKKRQQRSRQRSIAATHFIIFMKVLPELTGDFRIFISVYQMLTNVGQTLALTFPDSVENTIAMMRQLVNFDLFSFAAITCVTGSNYYQKLWLALFVPLCLLTVVWHQYHSRLSALHLTHLPDAKTLKKMQEAQKQLDAVHSKRQLAKHAGIQERIRFGLVRLYHHNHDERNRAEEEAEDAHERAFENDRQMRKIYRKLDKKAQIQQGAVSAASLVVFLVYLLR